MHQQKSVSGGAHMLTCAMLEWWVCAALAHADIAAVALYGGITVHFSLITAMQHHCSVSIWIGLCKEALPALRTSACRFRSQQR